MHTYVSFVYSLLFFVSFMKYQLFDWYRTDNEISYAYNNDEFS